MPGSTAGVVRIDGNDVTGWRPYKFARQGITHAPEGRSVFASLTVEENLERPGLAVVDELHQLLVGQTGGVHGTEAAAGQQHGQT